MFDIRLKPGWTIIDLLDDKGEIHAVPLDDTHDHISEVYCNCTPTITDETKDGLVLTHTAFDGREHSESDHDWKQCRPCIDKHITKIQKRQAKEGRKHG